MRTGLKKVKQLKASIRWHSETGELGLLGLKHGVYKSCVGNMNESAVVKTVGKLDAHMRVASDIFVPASPVRILKARAIDRADIKLAHIGNTSRGD